VETVTTPEQLKGIVEAEMRRRVGATALNEHSSRSHFITTLLIESKNKVDKRKTKRKTSFEHLSMLASSPRITGGISPCAPCCAWSRAEGFDLRLRALARP